MTCGAGLLFRAESFLGIGRAGEALPCALQEGRRTELIARWSPRPWLEYNENSLTHRFIKALLPRCTKFLVIVSLSPSTTQIWKSSSGNGWAIRRSMRRSSASQARAIWDATWWDILLRSGMKV